MVIKLTKKKRIKKANKTEKGGMMSSLQSTWETPAWLIEDLSEVFKWDWDVCASKPNVCENFYTKEDDGIRQRWSGLCWMNPPYGDEIDDWFNKAANSKEATVVCLVPARTDTRWWHDQIRRASFVVFIEGRIKFIDPTGIKSGGAPFPSAFVVFGEINKEQRDKLSKYGWAATQEKI